jgi:hypothetical protein
MSAPDDDDQAALPLPGIGDAQPTSAGGITPLEQACRRSLAALEDAGLLSERHAVTMQLVLDLSRSVGRASNKGQAAAAAMAAAQLREAWALLPQPDGAEQGDEWDELARDLRAAAAEERTRHRVALGLTDEQ